MIPVQIWWCSDWIFVFTKKDPVLAPPKPHRDHWNGYKMKYSFNTEVQGLVPAHGNIVPKLGLTLHQCTKGGWLPIWSLHLRNNRGIRLIPILWIPAQICAATGFLFLWERSSLRTTESAPESMVWVLLGSYNQSGGARTGSAWWSHCPEIRDFPTHIYRRWVTSHIILAPPD